MLKLNMLISAASGHRGYTHTMHGKYQLVRRFSTLLCQNSGCSHDRLLKKNFHCDSQYFYGQTESCRGNNLSSAMCQVNRDALVSDVLGCVDSFILWVHLWTLPTHLHSLQQVETS